MWKHSNVWSLAVLIGRGLNRYYTSFPPTMDDRNGQHTTKILVLDPFTCLGANRLLIRTPIRPPARPELVEEHEREISFATTNGGAYTWIHVSSQRGVEQWQLVGLITQRSQVRVLPPLPNLLPIMPTLALMPPFTLSLSKGESPSFPRHICHSERSEESKAADSQPNP